MAHFDSIAAHGLARLHKSPALVTGKPLSSSAWGRLETPHINGYILTNIAANDGTGQELRCCYWDPAPENGIVAADCMPVAGCLSAVVLFSDFHIFNKPLTFFACSSRHQDNNLRKMYVGGKGEAANASPQVSQTLIDRTVIGAKGTIETPTRYSYHGEIRWVALWNVDITENVARQLALGAHPLFTHPRGLLAFLPLDDANPADWVGSPWTKLGGAIMSGVRPFAIRKRQKVQRVYGRAACPVFCEGRRVVGL